MIFSRRSKDPGSSIIIFLSKVLVAILLAPFLVVSLYHKTYIRFNKRISLFLYIRLDHGRDSLCRILDCICIYRKSQLFQCLCRIRSD